MTSYCLLPKPTYIWLYDWELKMFPSHSSGSHFGSWAVFWYFADCCQDVTHKQGRQQATRRDVLKEYLTPPSAPSQLGVRPADGAIINTAGNISWRLTVRHLNSTPLQLIQKDFPLLAGVDLLGEKCVETGDLLLCSPADHSALRSSPRENSTENVRKCSVPITTAVCVFVSVSK